MSVRRVVSGGNFQRLGNRERVIGMDALEQGEGNTSDVHDQGFNEVDISSPSIPPLVNTTHPLSVCSVGKQIRWLCHSQ